MDSSTAGIIAIGAGALAVAGLTLSAILASRLRGLRAAQHVVLGEGAGRDIVEHAGALEQRLSSLSSEVEESVRRLDGRDVDLSERLDRAISQCGVVRYDAMGEMSGRQSSSIALLDSHNCGVVLSSILHRDHARLYAKPIVDGQSEFELSPEEQEALDAARAMHPQ